jgi:hypothetical protein
MSTSIHSNDLVQAMKKSLMSLNAQRLSLEREAEVITSELTDASQGTPMGLETPLVDSDGYPRGDIDIIRARVLRARLKEIGNDHKALMKDVERSLAQVAALHKPDSTIEEQKEQDARMQTKPKPKYDPVSGKWVVRNWDGSVAGVPGGEHRSFDGLSSTSAATQEAAISMSRTDTSTGAVPSMVPTAVPLSIPQSIVNTTFVVPTRPFARIDSVAPHSPAQSAGLKENDLILQFGDIHVENALNPMHEVADLVPRAAGEQASITILVSRRSEREDASLVVTAHLTPRPWSGRGLIGCHIVPYHI